MLINSFIFLPGIGHTTERRLWEDGVLDWKTFLERPRAGPIKGDRKIRLDSIITEALDNLETGNLRYFSSIFSCGETWRLWSDFSYRAVFVDIETTGTGRYSPITVVGCYDGEEYRSAVRGFNLQGEEVERMLSEASMIVTFNGATFDLPIIENHFPGSLPRVPHLDLRFLARKAGFVGGLKSVERALGIERPDDVKGMSGEDAVRLWWLWNREGNRNALKLLLKYNMEDVINLKDLAEVLVRRMTERYPISRGGSQ